MAFCKVKEFEGKVKASSQTTSAGKKSVWELPGS